MFCNYALQSKICSTVLLPAAKLASPCFGGWSTVWSCSPSLSEGSILWWGYSQVIWSTPLATSSALRSCDKELIVFSLFLPPHYLSFQRGRHSFTATCLFSLLVLLPLQYRRTVLAFSRRPVGLYYGAVGVE